MSQNGDNRNCSNNNVKEIKFNLSKSVQVCKVMIHTDTRLTKNDAIFTMVDMNGQQQSFLSPISGTITKLYIHELDVLSYGSVIFEYEECRHRIIFKNLCGDCGIDLNQQNNALPVSISAKSVISMEPSFPEVTITLEEALKYDHEDRDHLIRKRKLHLLVDLDETLVHTTNSKNPYPSSPEVVAYQLNTPTSQTFYTKLRPGVKEFLTNLQPLYQFHIVTFGDRPYAHTIAKLIDPDGEFFYNRILSRNECLSLTHKTANLNTLFPCGDSLVCIIDDREDVWNDAPNLVHVKPYTWFKDVGDINHQIENNEKKHLSGKKRKSYEENDAWSKNLKGHNNQNVVVDTDHYLHQLEMILKCIHTAFYLTYDQSIEEKRGTLPDLKQIMPGIRRQVLRSVSLCFSHLLPQNYPLEKHRATIIAQAMGAKVTHDLEIGSDRTVRTTHVIAGKQTMKVHQALQNNIKVVTPEWLIDCYEQWEKKSEENYILTPEYDVQKSRLFTKEIPRVSKRSYCDMQQQVSGTQQSSSNDIKKDAHDDDLNETRPRPSKQQRIVPIAEIVDENTDENDNDDVDSDSSYGRKLHNLILSKRDDSSSDEERLSDDEVPRGWKKSTDRTDSIRRFY